MVVENRGLGGGHVCAHPRKVPATSVHAEDVRPFLSELKLAANQVEIFPYTWKLLKSHFLPPAAH